MMSAFVLSARPPTHIDQYSDINHQGCADADTRLLPTLSTTLLLLIHHRRSTQGITSTAQFNFFSETSSIWCLCLLWIIFQQVLEKQRGEKKWKINTQPRYQTHCYIAIDCCWKKKLSYREQLALSIIEQSFRSNRTVEIFDFRPLFIVGKPFIVPETTFKGHSKSLVIY